MGRAKGGVGRLTSQNSLSLPTLGTWCGRERAGVIDKADRETKGTGGLYLGPAGEEGSVQAPGEARGSPASRLSPFLFLSWLENNKEMR